jgi:hypothetical protein
MSNPLLDRYAKGRHGTRSERRVAKKMKARLTPGSGSKAWAKGDSVLPDLLIESKATIYDSMVLKHSFLRKITKEALETNRVPALTASFVTSSGEKKLDGDWIMVPLWVWQAHDSKK